MLDNKFICAICGGNFEKEWSDEEAAQLFADQPDYNHEISLAKVIEIRGYGYKPYSCTTLKDKCGGLVGQYCRDCKSTCH